MTDKELATLIAKKVRKIGGVAYYVGGYVRDRILGIENKDIDIEVHKITPDDLKAILNSIGECIEHGKSFGVYGIKGYNLDISMPRTERLVGNKHTSFDVCVDPFLGELEATQRRDFTINSIMQNVLSGEIIDYWGGGKDLQFGSIHHINEEKFIEDPLRVLRAARFSAKLGFSIAPSTVDLCKTIDVSKLSKERIMGEVTSTLLKSPKPSVFFEALREMQQLDFWFPELQNLINTPQNQQYHQEGDVWTHTMMVLDTAARMRDKAEYPLGFMFSALCHDLGKPLCTSIDDKGVVHSYEHENKGVPVAEVFLSRLTTEVALKKYVLNMVALHQKPNRQADSKSKIKSTNKTFDESVMPSDLILLSRCDNLGRLPSMDNTKEFLEERLEIYNSTMAKPFVQGRDLIQAGLKPNQNFSILLEYAHKLRLARVDKANTLRQTLAMARKLERQERLERKEKND